MTELAEYLQSLSEKRRQGFSASFEIRDAFRKAAVEIERQAAEIAKLRAALTTCRLYVADEIIGAAVVVPAGEEPDARRHPSLLQMIDAVLRPNEQKGESGS